METPSIQLTGIAATLVINGKTFHSQFKLFISPITETTASKIEFQCFWAKELKKSKLVIWNEGTMTPFHALTAVDKLLRILFEKPDVPVALIMIVTWQGHKGRILFFLTTSISCRPFPPDSTSCFFSTSLTGA